MTLRMQVENERGVMMDGAGVCSSASFSFPPFPPTTGCTGAHAVVAL